jgi:eukaryotic-like serine/threonine-protein kinase
MAAPMERPRIVGRYAIYGEIASGGMATVHFGRLLGPAGFTRTVAIKMLHPQFAKDAEFAVRFMDEARLAARIRHPNVVQTLDVVAAERELFLVMDYVQAETLSRLRRIAAETGAQVPLRVATSIMCGVLHGLHAAHEATSDRGESLGIVHRDVSPQNVLVGLDGIARLLDFGIAKAMGRAYNTRDGGLKGKVAYMGPEQFEGKVTRRTDIFSAAVVLWELVVGERLFEGDDDRMIIGKVLAGDVEAPCKGIRSRTSAIEATAQQLDELDAITLRGLAPRPEDRFETAHAMALALEKCLGIASPREVGEWVESLAAALLRQRADHVAAIERDSSSLGHPADAPEGPSPTSPTSGPADDITRAEGTSPTIPWATSASQATAPFRRAGWVIGTIGFAAIAGISLSRFAPSQSAPAPAAVAASASAPAAADSRSVESSTPPVASASSASSSPSASSSNTASGPRSAPAAAARRTPRPSAECDPPYTVDSAGHQFFKEECFR